MEKLIALTVNNQTIQAPEGVPTGISLAQIVSVTLGAMMAIGIILALFFLIWGGFQWVISGGDKEKLEKARKTIIYSILGLIIMATALVVVNVITTALGVETVWTSQNSPSSNTRVGPGCTTCPDGTQLCADDFTAGLSCDNFR